MFKIGVFKDEESRKFCRVSNWDKCAWLESANSRAFGQRQEWVIEIELAQEEIASAIIQCLIQEEM